jgi:hypothetical protein
MVLLCPRHHRMLDVEVIAFWGWTVSERPVFRRDRELLFPDDDESPGEAGPPA